MMQRVRNLMSGNLLIKVASLNSVSVGLRILGGLLTSKFIALFIGPSGLALIANLRDVFNALQSISILGLYNGIIKYVAELKDRSLELSKLLSTVFYLVLGIVLAMSITVLVLAPWLNSLLFLQGADHINLIRILAIAIPFYALKTLVFAWLNGRSEFKKLLQINIISQLFAVAINCLLIYYYGLTGALFFIVIIEIILCLVVVIGVFKMADKLPAIATRYFSKSILYGLSSYSIMALVTAILLPLSSVYIRNYMMDNLGDQEAGFWVAMTRISNYYLMFISSLIAMYVLPKLSQAKTDSQFRKEVFHFYKSIMPIFIVGLGLVYMLRSFIVSTIFSDEFQPVASLFKYQLLGDLLKVLAMVISYQFLAKKMVWHYVLTEIISILILVLASLYCIDRFGMEGATMGHLISYVAYLAMMLGIFYKPLFGKLRD